MCSNCGCNTLTQAAESVSDLKLKKDACCCGATKKTPCICMILGSQCSSVKPMCPCYRLLSVQTKDEKNAEEGDNCPSCANSCKHDDTNMIKVESIYDYEVQSPTNMVIQVTCLECGESGTFFADEVDWEQEDTKLRYSPQIAVNMMNPTYGDLKCPRCYQRFEMAAEEFWKGIDSPSKVARMQKNYKKLSHSLYDPTMEYNEIVESKLEKFPSTVDYYGIEFTGGDSAIHTTKNKNMTPSFNAEYVGQLTSSQQREIESRLRDALSYLPPEDFEDALENGMDSKIKDLADTIDIEEFFAETFEAKGKGKSILEVFSDNNAVLTAFQGDIEEYEANYGHREVESFLMEFSPDMKSCELVLLRNLGRHGNSIEKEGFFLCGVVNFKGKHIWSWVHKGLYKNPMWEEMQKLNSEYDSPLFKTMLKTYEKKLEEIGFKNPRMDYYEEEGSFEMKFDSYAPVYCTSHDWGEAYVKDLSKDGVTFQQECSFCGITRRGYSDVKLDWDMEAESFEARDDSWCVNHGWIHTARAGDIIPCTSCNDMICEGCRCGGCGNCENSDCCECKNAENFEADTRKYLGVWVNKQGDKHYHLYSDDDDYVFGELRYEPNWKAKGWEHPYWDLDVRGGKSLFVKSFNEGVKAFRRETMNAETFESVVVAKKLPTTPVQKAMLNRAMMEQAEIEHTILDLETKARLGLLDERALMQSLAKKFGAEGAEEINAYYQDFKEKHPELHETFVLRVANEDSWWGEYRRDKSYQDVQAETAQMLAELGYDFDMIDDYWEAIGYDMNPIYETCPDCEGEGIIITRYYPATRDDPADADYVTCEMCDGEGKVLDNPLFDSENEEGSKAFMVAGIAVLSALSIGIYRRFRK